MDVDLTPLPSGRKGPVHLWATFAPDALQLPATVCRYRYSAPILQAYNCAVICPGVVKDRQSG